MTAKNQNFTMNVGETKKIEVDQTDDEDDGGDLDMTGYQSLTWYLKESESGPTLVEKDDSSTDVTVTDKKVGAYEVTIQPSDTADSVDRLEEHYYHRVRFVDSVGRESDLLEGTITVNNV